MCTPKWGIAAGVQKLMADRRVEYHPTVSLTALQLAQLMSGGCIEDIRQRIRQRQDEDRHTMALVMERKNRERQAQGEMNIPQDIIRDAINSNL